MRAEFLFFSLSCVEPGGEIFNTSFLFHWELCWPSTNAVCQPSLRIITEDFFYYLKE